MSLTASSQVRASTQDKHKFPNSVLLKLPKFSKNYSPDDFIKGLEGVIEKSEIRVLGRLKYPNEWTMTLSCTDARERMLQLGSFTVSGHKCVVHPQAENEIRGRIHWLPGELGDERMVEILSRFGDVVSFKKEMVYRNTQELRSSVRSFSLVLKAEVKVDDIPHFVTINNCEGLITIKNRDPMCLGCRQHGHRKSVCPNSAKKKFVSKKPSAKNTILKDDCESAKDAKKKKKKKQKKVSPSDVEMKEEKPAVGTVADSNEVINLERSINSFILQVSETLNKLKGNSATFGAAPSSSATVQPVNSNQFKPKNVKPISIIKKEPNVASGNVGGTSNTIFVNSGLISAQKSTAVASVNTKCVNGPSSTNCDVEDGASAAQDSIGKKKKNKKKKKKVQFDVQF